MQEESEGMNEALANSYGSVEKQFVKSLRERYSSYMIDGGFFFVDAGISDVYHWPFYRIVNNAKLLNSQEESCWGFIDTIASGLHSDQEPYGNVDLAHYDVYSEIKLGQLFGAAIIQELNYCTL